MRRLMVAVFSVAWLAGNARAGGDSLDDLIGPREIAVGEAMRGGATGASGIDLNPAGLALNRELVFEGGYGYRAADSASLVGVSACDSTNAVPGCFFYHYAGASPEDGAMSARRTTHVGGMALSRTLVPRILIGATAKYYRFSSTMTDETDASGTAFDVGATVRVADNLNFGASAQNLWASAETPQFPRAIGGGFYARPIPVLSIGFDMRWRLDGASTGARYGGGAELFLRGDGGQTGYALRAGGLRDNALGATFASAGLGYATMSWSIDVSGRRAVKGGDESIVIASMRFFGPRLAAPSVGEM